MANNETFYQNERANRRGIARRKQRFVHSRERAKLCSFAFLDDFARSVGRRAFLAEKPAIDA